jgi:flagellar motility protein MotE (MotC chaperone)
MMATSRYNFLVVGMVVSLACESGSFASEVMPRGVASNDKDVVKDYCLNISDKAAEARTAHQMEALKVLEVRIEVKAAELDSRREELQSWMEKQRLLQEAADAGLVEIYAAMDPEAAAKQMSSLDLRLASSLLRKLKPRVASTILNEMKPELAATLIKTIAATADLPANSRR